MSLDYYLPLATPGRSLVQSAVSTERFRRFNLTAIRARGIQHCPHADVWQSTISPLRHEKTSAKPFQTSIITTSYFKTLRKTIMKQAI
jgi:hypothetical protein